MEEADEGNKKPLLVIKRGQTTVTSADYRALLAVLLVSAFVYVVIVDNCNAIAALGPMAGAAVTYYFHSRALRDCDRS